MPGIPHTLQFTEDIQIPVPWGHIAAKVWGPENGRPVLALHGWLDNAGSFDTLAPLLPPDLRLICLDMGGHGLSSHYPHKMFLHFFDHVYHIKLVFEHFKWKKIIIMGHSMGGFAAMLFTAMYPEMVEKFISLDMVKLSSIAEYLPFRMRSIYNSFEAFCAKMEAEDSGLPFQEVHDKFVKSYLWSIDEKDAKVLLVRGMIRTNPTKDSWKLSRDWRTMVRPYEFNDITVELARAIAQCIKCPFLLIKAKIDSSLDVDGTNEEFYNIFHASSSDFRLVHVDGRHHVHVSRPELVAPHIIDFINNSTRSSKDLHSKL